MKQFWTGFLVFWAFVGSLMVGNQVMKEPERAPFRLDNAYMVYLKDGKHMVCLPGYISQMDTHRDSGLDKQDPLVCIDVPHPEQWKDFLGDKKTGVLTRDYFWDEIREEREILDRLGETAYP